MVATAIQIHAPAVKELVRAGANPLDLVAEHLRQGADTSIHVLSNGENIGVLAQDGLLTLLVVPRHLPVGRT